MTVQTNTNAKVNQLLRIFKMFTTVTNLTLKIQKGNKIYYSRVINSLQTVVFNNKDVSTVFLKLVNIIKILFCNT